MMIFDSRDFDSKFKKIVKDAIPAAAEKGLGRAMLDLENDCVMEVPTVPLKEGFLRGSASMFVQNELVGIAIHGKAKFAKASLGMSIPGGKLVGVIGFNAPYAAKLHEGMDLSFTESSSGPKYLESKLQKNRKAYMKQIAKTIAKAGR
jgi:hypothetical protein